jgi:hypothetical protein
MFVFSEIHNWQENEAVQQILVFSSPEMKDLFEHEMESRLVQERTQRNDNPTDSAIRENLSDSNAGAVYKLRAVKNSDGKWIPVIRCGVTGGQIGKDGMLEDTAKKALTVCVDTLRIFIGRKCEELYYALLEVPDETAVMSLNIKHPLNIEVKGDYDTLDGQGNVISIEGLTLQKSK